MAQSVAIRLSLGTNHFAQVCFNLFPIKFLHAPSLRSGFHNRAFARKCHAAYVIPAQAGIQTEDFHINSLDSRFRENDGILLFGESLGMLPF